MWRSKELMNWTLSSHRSGLIYLKQWNYWATQVMDMVSYFNAKGQVTLCYILKCIQCTYWWHVCLQGQSFPAGQAAFQGGWENSEYFALPIMSLIQYAFSVTQGRTRMLLCFCPHPVPLCAWGESGKRSMGRSIASLTAMHKGYHNLLTPMKEKCWCFYWANGYLPLTIPSSYDSTDTHYGMEGELRHFSENNANVSGLAPKVTFERSVGRILINCFGALSIALCPSADHPVPW